MNNSSIKLFCILFILMYCLAPLSAIDLNQDNNTTIKNMNDSSNDTIEDNGDIEIKKINDTEGKNKDIEIKKINETNESNIEDDKKADDLKYKPYIHVEMPDIDKGQKPIIYVADGYGYHLHYCSPVEVTCPQFSHKYEFELHDYAPAIMHSYELDENLPPGTYTVTAHYPGSRDYDSWTGTCTFTVRSNLDPKINAQIDNITEGQKLKIKITANESFNGLVFVKTDDKRSFTISVKNGVGEKTYDNVPAGNYTATVYNKKDKTWNKVEKTVKFTVSENNNTKPNFVISVDNITIGEDAIVKINTNESFNDDVSLTILGKKGDNEETVKITNGVGQATIHDLDIGLYSAIVRFDGSDKYRASANCTTFKVNDRADPGLSIYVENNTIADKTNIEVHGNARLSEPVNVQLNNSQEYTVKLENGSGNVVIDDLGTGRYSATISYEGDKYFKPGKRTTQFVKTGTQDPNLRIRINDTIPGEVPVVEISGDESFNGRAWIRCPQFHYGYGRYVHDGYSKEIIDKEGDLPIGNYTVTVMYDGDDTFRASNATTSFKVALGDPDMSIDVDKVLNKREGTKIKINAHKLLNGTVKVNLKSPSDSKTVTVKVRDGAGQASVSDLKEETYTVDATFDGNEKFNPGSATTNFTVKLADPNLSMDVEKMGYGETTAKITVHANESLNGDVKVKIKSQHDNNEATVKIVNGVGEAKFDALTIGDTYNATATFDGNDIISAGSANTSFKINRRL